MLHVLSSLASIHQPHYQVVQDGAKVTLKAKLSIMYNTKKTKKKTSLAVGVSLSSFLTEEMTRHGKK